MVSIAESFNYRIFERKRRMGEALHESSPCMPHLSVEQQKKSPLVERSARERAFLLTKPNRESDAWLKITKRTTSVFCIFERASACSKKCQFKKISFEERSRETHQETCFFSGVTQKSLFQNIVFLFTDLSAAGLPAELKHITQRRKRKQP